MKTYKEELEQVLADCYSNSYHLEKVIKVKHYIDTHFETDLKLEVLANKSCTSPYHLLRLFKRYYGQTPHQYLIEKRIQEAKIRLREGSSVSETCFAVGFQSLGSFSNLFKRIHGKTPSSYRKEQFLISISGESS